MIHAMKNAALMVVTTLAATMFFSAPASAQATRTWISGVGDDVNPCSRTAPCKTFGGALAKTAGGGEINCLDPGGFGSVTITKSISLVCDNTEAGVLVAATNAIIINGSGIVVEINGLDIEGLGQTGVAGVNGIYFLNGASLTVRNTKIRGFRNGYGISFTPGSNAALTIDNVTISESGSASDPFTGAIQISPLLGIIAQASLTNVKLVDNLNTALRIDTLAGGGASATVTVDNSLLSNDGTGIMMRSAAGAPASLMLTNSTVSGNSTTGIFAKGAATVARVGNTSITGNNAALFVGGGASIFSYGNNRVDGNTIDTAFTLPVIATH